jgi:hypothetical protein
MLGEELSLFLGDGTGTLKGKDLNSVLWRGWTYDHNQVGLALGTPHCPSPPFCPAGPGLTFPLPRAPSLGDWQSPGLSTSINRDLHPGPATQHLLSSPLGPKWHLCPALLEMELADGPA